MYKFHFDYSKNNNEKNSKLLFRETDSLMYKFKTKDIYNDFSSYKEMLDFRSYSTRSKY